MRINPITMNNNKQITFNGTVDKKVVKLIDIATDNSVKIVVDRAKKDKRKLFSAEILDLKNIKELKDSTLEILSNYMAKLHPDTTLTTNGKYLAIENRKTKTSLDFCLINLYPGEKHSIHKCNKIDIYDPMSEWDRDLSMSEVDVRQLGSRHIKQLKILGHELTDGLEPASVDKALFDQFINKLIEKAKSKRIFGDSRTLSDGLKADMLASEFGIQGTIWSDKLMEIREEAKNLRVQKKAKAKIAKESNENTLKEIFG